MKTIFLNVGDIVVSREPAILKTVLGSCVAVSLWDKRRRIGGLNHYILPSGAVEEKCSRFGLNAIEMLINGMEKLGADRKCLLAGIFGGNSMADGLNLFRVGSKNVNLARARLKAHGIVVVEECVGNIGGISMTFDTQTGETKVKMVGYTQGDAVWEAR